MTLLLECLAVALGTGAFFGCMIWAIKSIVPHESVTDNAGAVEGNDRNFRVPSIYDDHFWDDV
ncbi:MULTISPECIES: hypothetical protein [unclassified Rhizobium]|uniref:hypothetical protein n=1 Tax=unclassified Rhizobium TaxID=2613769 RepID=UPI003819DF50